MELLGNWGGAFQQAWLPAVLAAALVLAALLVLRVANRWLRRGRESQEAARAVDILSVLGEVQRAKADLAELGTQLENRIDEKLDRLERLIAASRRLGDDGAEVEPHRPAPQPATDHRPVDSQAGGVSARDRERVLQLAALGKLPETIAQSVGLLRGEVDLILRLHKIAEQVEQP